MKADFASKRPVKVWKIMVVVVAVLAVVVGCVVNGRLTATNMNLIRTEGTVDVSDAEGKAVKLRENLGLYGGYQVGTQSMSFAWIDLDKVKLTKLDQNSEIKINKEDKHLEIEVTSGSLFFNIAQPLAEDETLDIRTSTMLVGIRGTCGWVEDNGASGARVFILEGTVEAEAVKTGETVSVSAGEMGRVFMNEAGEAGLEVVPFAEEYVPSFVLDELEENGELSAAVLEASGLDALNPTDPVERLKAEYQEMVTERPLYSAVSEGLCFADYVDFEGDGIPELMLVSQANRQSGDDLDGPLAPHIEIYGSMMGYAKPWSVDLSHGEVAGFDRSELSLVQKEGQTYIKKFTVDGQNSQTVFYGAENGKLYLVDMLDAMHVDAYETGYSSMGEAITAEQFQERVTQYTDERMISSSQFSSFTVQDRGILPELPDDVRRRAAFVEALNSSASNYARLIDMDGDGVEELLVRNSNRMTAYIWDGAQAEPVSLTQHAPQFSTAYLYWDIEGIYREKATNKVYVRYLISDELYPSGYVFESLTDYSEYRYHMGRQEAIDQRQYEPETEEEWAGIYAIADESERQRQAVENEITSRFELIEDAEAWKTDAAENVRQQLMNG